MCKKLIFLISFVVVLGMGTSAWADYINDTQTWATVNIQDLTDKTLEIGPSGNLTITGRVNMDANAVIIMSGGVLTTEGEFKFPDSDGEERVQMWINSGMMTADNIENRTGDGRGDAIYVGGGTLVVQRGYLNDIYHSGINEWYDPNEWLNKHTFEGHPVLLPAPGYTGVVIEDLGGGTCRITAASAIPTASEPNPLSTATGVCPEDVQLSWTPTDEIIDPNHDVYFGTDYNDVRDANRNNHPAGVSYSEDRDSNKYPEDGDPLLQLELNTIYFWRVNEVNGLDVYESPVVWQFTTDDGNAMDPSPVDGYYRHFPGEPLTWTPSCVATSQDVYLSTDFSEVDELQGTALYASVGAADNNVAPSLDSFTTYYWRIDTAGGGDGEIWSLNTGLGGLLMYYKFDGTPGNQITSPVIDDSGNNVAFTKYVDVSTSGYVKYGQSNPVIDLSTASADFEPNAGLFRADTGEHDILRLDGREYTIEMWLRPELLTDAHGNITLIGKPGGRSWLLEIDDPGDDNQYRWTQGSGDEGDGEAIVGEWAHIAAVYNRNTATGQMKFYVNGVLTEIGNELRLNPPDSNLVTIAMTKNDTGNYTGFFDGLIDELRIYDIALAPCDFLLTPGPQWASCPTPYDSEVRVDPCTVVLMWTPGQGAVDHDIYFSSDFNDVNSPSAIPVQTSHAPNSWTPPEIPAYGTVYYWRIDSNDGSPSLYQGLVWRFTTKADIVDPNMFVWYKFDETSGDDVMDSSGREIHGVIDDDQDDTWDPCDGRFPGCIHFHQDERIDLADEVFDYIGQSISISVWWKDAYNDDDENYFCGFGDDDLHMLVRAPDGEGNPGVIWQAGNDTNDVLKWTTNGLTWKDNWHHLVFTKNGPEGTMKIYFDAVLVASTTEANGVTLGQAAANEEEGFRIGAQWDEGDGFAGKADDFRVYACEISQSKIDELFRAGDVGVAWGPSPYDEQIDVPYDVNLAWLPGDYVNDVNGHDVYFGTDFDDVNDANSTTHPNVEYGNVTDTNYALVELLELGQIYYWRVDEVNDPCTWKGEVWRFTVAEYITIDDMEDYGPGYPISSAIADEYGWDSGVSGNGTGSALGLVTPTEYTWVLAHGGNQAMYYTYDSSGHPYYSEIVNSPHFELDPNDWTTAGVKMLTLWFHGDFDWEIPATAVERMYVGLEDTGNTYAEVVYGDGEGEDVNDIAIAEWQEWNIALSSFTAVNLESMAKLYIGFGDRDDPVEGGVGNVVFDSIRLYKPTCVPSKRPSAFAELDMDNDCAIGWGDVEIMGEEWLESDINLGQVTAPPDGNLVGWWKFDEGSGSNADDSSDYDHDGTLEISDVNVWWVDGRGDVNHALDFDGGRVRVPDHQDLRPMDQVSVSAWIKYSDEQDDARVVVKGADNKETFDLEVDEDDELKFLVRDGNDYDPCDDKYAKYETESDDDELERDEWIHIAGTYDGNTVKCYINGELAAENNDPNISAIRFLCQDTNDLGIGMPPDEDDDEFEGIIDDVRIYDYGLSAQEVAYLASDGTGVVSMQSIADLYEDPPGKGAVNFKDFDKLADRWLEEDLWPQ